PVPLAIPAVRLDVSSQLGRFALAAFSEGQIAAPPRRFSEALEHFMREESQPHTFAPALRTHAIHTVVPVAGADERKAVATEAEPVQNGAGAMRVQGVGFRGAPGQVVVRVLLRVDRTSVEERDHLVQHAGVSGAEGIATGGKRQPEVVVRTVGAHATSRWWMPPVLDVPLVELVSRAQEQLLAQQACFAVNETPSLE